MSILTKSVPGREDDALTTLVTLRRVPQTDHRLQAEFLEIKAARMFDQQTKIEKYGENIPMLSPFQVALREYKELFVVSHLRKRTMVACLLQILQQFTGISKFSMGIHDLSEISFSDSSRRCYNLLRSSIF